MFLTDHMRFQLHSTRIRPLSNQAWRHKHVILALRKTRQENSKFTGGEERRDERKRGEGQDFSIAHTKKVA